MPIGGGGACPSTLDEYGRQTARARRAYLHFFLSMGYHHFLGSQSHLQHLIDQVHDAVPVLRNATLIDVGAGQYNVVGGDISHALHFARTWPCGDVRAILGFEPVPESFNKLANHANRALGGPARGRNGTWSHRCVRLARNAVSSSESVQTVTPQWAGGFNTAGLEKHFHGDPKRPDHRMHIARMSRKVRTVTIDAELARLGLPAEVLILKVDVEGHEMSVLHGAAGLMREGRAHMILIEYGDKTSKAIWDGMKTPGKAAAAAPTPAELPEPSLFSIQRWADGLGYDAFYVGELGRRAVLVPITGFWWDDRYEVSAPVVVSACCRCVLCRDDRCEMFYLGVISA